MDSRKRQQKYAEYCRNRAEFYRLERLKVINSFWRKYRSGTYPVDVLLHRLKEGLYFNSGGSTEWQEEFAQVVDELNRESTDEQQRFYQESKAVSPYTDGINLDAYYRIFGLTPETLTAESLKRRIAPYACNIIPTATNSRMPPSGLTKCRRFMKPCNGSWRIKTYNGSPDQASVMPQTFSAIETPAIKLRGRFFLSSGSCFVSRSVLDVAALNRPAGEFQSQTAILRLTVLSGIRPLRSLRLRNRPQARAPV